MEKGPRGAVRVDAPTAARTALLGVVVAVGLTLIFGVFQLRGVSVLANPLAYLLVGGAYAVSVGRRTRLGWLEAAAGGAFSGVTAGLLVVVAEAVVGAVLQRIDFPFPASMLATSATELGSTLLSSMVVGACLAALGAAWVVVLETQRIEPDGPGAP